MPEKTPDFSEVQWEFVSITAVFGEPVSIDVLGSLVPLSPGEFLDLLRKIEHIGWMTRNEDDMFFLSNDVPEKIKSKLNKINSKQKISDIIETLEKNGLINAVPQSALAKCLQKSGKNKKALRLEMQMAIDALKVGDKDTGKKHIKQIEALLHSLEGAEIKENWFIQDSLKLAQLSQGRAVGFPLIFHLLDKIIRLTEKTGDERSWTIAHFLIGRAYWSSDKLQESVRYLEKGKKKAEELGDSDILAQSASYIGIYYFIKGLHNKAIPYLELAVDLAENTEKYPMSFESPILLAYCDVDRGDFHRAIGKLDFFRHSALRREDYSIAALYRAVLGIILWLIRKRKEALLHLEGSQTDALATNNMVAYWTSLYGLSSLYLSEGDVEKGLLFLNQAIKIAEQSGGGHQIFHSIFLESYATVELAGLELPKGWRFDELFDRIMSEPNIHVQGVALRLRAARAMSMSQESDNVIKELNKSDVLLRKCGDPVELAKTRIEKVRYYLKQKDIEKARGLAYESYELLSGYSEVFFPDDLRFLLGSVNRQNINQQEPDDIIESFIRMMEELIPGPSHQREMDTLLSTLSRFFRAERCGLFLFSEVRGKNFELKTGRNLSPVIIQAQNFKENLAIIFRSYHEQKPIVIQPTAAGVGAKKNLSVLCLPLIGGKRVVGVLYFDNSYLGNCFDFVKTPTLNRLGHYLTNIIEKYIRFGQAAEKQEKDGAVKPISSNSPVQAQFITKDPMMLRILNQAERQAKSDAAILILGDTGVGKEVLARWIHQHSHRDQKPFVVVDLATIPENLMESELFGHEKGAFTGADGQKIGRVELAHNGTLFIDEIGEISRELQIKLLRLLQEKTFVRVGGTKTLQSDFRLITATNRSLADEIASGGFREDLYYRLNVLELTIPPLKERHRDVVPLAQYYLEHYAKKYHVSLPHLTKDQEVALKAYEWPGNVRELKNVVERAVIVSEGNLLEFDFSVRTKNSVDNPFSDLPTLDEIQRRYINYVLEKTNGRIGGDKGAAQILGMKRTSVNSRMKRLGIK